MKKEIIAALIANGFTPEELYDQGILAPAAAPATDLAADPAPASDSLSEPDPAPIEAQEPAADPAVQGDAVLAAIMGLRNDIVKAIQQNNLAGAERAGGENKQMSVEDAIIGLSKGV